VIDGVTRTRLSLWICNSNRNLQHAIADRQSNFQACAIDHSAISPIRIKNLRYRVVAKNLDYVYSRPHPSDAAPGSGGGRDPALRYAI
jgi:hypothetical protein